MIRARPMSRLIHDKIKQSLANEILFGKLANGGSVLVETDENGLQLDLNEKRKINVTE
ncbi:MAG: hypothetical protein IT173_11895 [Acidobacteria bacterium]|nr:hypothetical protein [Acidobacteriota bacterium]